MKSAKVTMLLFASLLFSLASCHTTPQNTPQTGKLPSAVQWVRQSLEYKAVCVEVYRAAWQAVKATAASTKEDWAVVLDVDETVLDNALFEEEIYQQGRSYSDSLWNVWVERREATAVPGSKAFLDSVRALGKPAHIVFITNRDAKSEQATRENLQSEGLWQDGDILLCRRDRADVKEIRRQEVASGTGRCAGMGTRQIIALVGDQLGDMVWYRSRASTDSLYNFYAHPEEWGKSQFYLPNPMYGGWQQGYK